MKLAFVVSGKSPTSMPGGLGSYSYNAARAMAELGYLVYVVGLSGEDAVLEKPFCTFVHVRSRLRKLASVTSFLMMRSLTRRILAIIDRDAGADVISEIVILGAGIWAKVGLDVKEAYAGRAPIRALGACFTTFRHEYAGQKRGAPAADYGRLKAWSVSLLCRFIDWFYVPVEHRVLKALDRIVVHYDSSIDIFVEEIPGLDTGRIRKVPYYIELYEREGQAHQSARDGTVSIVCICRQDPRKGLNTLLHALKLLKDRGVPFRCILAGNGPFRAPNAALAARLGLGGEVSFPGFVASAEELLDSTDIFVLPSVEEGAGAISLLEAMHKGLPIVTTRCDGIPEDFTDGENGFLVPMEDAGALAGRLEQLINDPALRRRLGDNVKKGYQEKFRFEYMVEGLQSVLKEF